jgi:uncharacterized membrane-anchored protein YjiN (DUF445 family)
MAEDAQRPLSLPAMRRLATGLLLVMVLLYLVARAQEQADVHFAWGFVRAFAEAAMIGGLADWFAVTAIFRRPLGLPIPHTAVIPKNQGRIADALGAFIADNFLQPDLVRARVAERDLAGGLARFLADPDHSARLARGAVSAIPPLLDTLDDETVAAFLRRQAVERGREARVSPGAGRILRALTEQGRHHPVVDAGLAEAWKALAINEPEIRARVRERTAPLWRLIKLDKQSADAIVGALADTLRAAATDPGHPLRVQATEALHRFARNLEHDPALQARVEAIKDDLLAHPAVQAYLDGVWGAAKAQLRADCLDPDSRLAGALAEALTALGRGLLEEAPVREALNERLRGAIVDLAGRHGPDVARIVSETVRGWDAKTVVDKLEQNVGRDLQYIRVSGTLIGGAVGLALHAVSLALKG